MTLKIADELSAIVETAEPVLIGLSNSTVSTRPAPDRWTIKEVIGHLIDSAANNHQRFVRAQFVEQLVFPKYEQNEWVGAQKYNDSDWLTLVSLWVLYNKHLAHVMTNVSTKALGIRCIIGDYQPVTLQFLIDDYVVHLKHHLLKIAERLNISPQKLGIT